MASVRKRFAVTIAANLLRSLMSFATGMLVARWLGPTSFGKMAFLLGTFLACRQLLDMGSSTAFFTFMSQRVRSRRFVEGFFVWLALQFVIPLFVIALFPGSWIENIWDGENRSLVLLAFAATFMQNTLWPVIQQAGESQRRTVWVQSVGVAVVGVHLLAMVLLWVFGRLGLYAIFAAVAVEYFVAALLVRKSLVYADADGSAESAGIWFRRYLRYCLPLIPYTWVGFAYEFADRWLLQNYGGSVEQAYYAVSAQISAIALLATASVLNIFWKEIAEAHHREDHARVRMLYRRVSRALYLIGAMVAGFLFPWTQDLLRLILGAAYVGGAATLTVMLFYPVHQSLGQISNSMLYATGRLGLQVGIGIATMIVSMVLTYFVLAPGDAAVPGLGLASTGLALKMVLLQLIQVNLLTYAICRLSGWSFDWSYQLTSLLGCIAAGWLSHGVVSRVAGDSWPLLAAMGAGGALYLLLMIVFVYTFPVSAGVTRVQLAAEARMAWQQATAGFRAR